MVSGILGNAGEFFGLELNLTRGSTGTDVEIHDMMM